MINEVEWATQPRVSADDCSSVRNWAQQRRVVARTLRHEAAQMRARTAAMRLTVASRRRGGGDIEALRRRLAAAERRAGDLEVALTSNRRIGMAIGILMARHRLTDVQAFNLLRHYSSRRNVKLAVVAEEVVYTGEPGGGRPDPAVRTTGTSHGPRSRGGHPGGARR